MNLRTTTYGTGDTHKDCTVTIPVDKNVTVTQYYNSADVHDRVVDSETLDNKVYTFVDNNSGYYQGGAIYSDGKTFGDITANFLNNSVSQYGGAISLSSGFEPSGPSTLGNITGNFINNFAGEDGGAIHNGGGSTIGNITGDFIKNSAKLGGAIANYKSTIGDITGHFINNSASNGGAIMNNGPGSTATIGNITGDFINNTATAYGGAIYNGGGSTIGNITGDFINNSAKGSSDSRASGGAINNNNKIGDITGNFINNSAFGMQTKGGAISTVGGTIGDITGDFTGNYISGICGYTTYDSQGGAIYAEGTTIGKITGNFTGNYAYFTTSNPGNIFSSDAMGGAIHNLAYSTSSYNATVIENITGDFTGNYATSNNHAYGGAIWNNGTITITGESDNPVKFTGNYAKIHTIDPDDSHYAWGGAIYNKGLDYDEHKGIINISNATFEWNGYDNYNGTSATNVATQSGGAIYNDANGKINISGTNTFSHNAATVNGGAICNASDATLNFTGTSTFTGNTAKDGGAIYNEGLINTDGDTITTLTANFSYNSVSGTYTSAYRGGGAIYNKNSIGNIEGNFDHNSSSGIYYSGNASGGGAINNSGGTIGNITGDFTNNTVTAENSSEGYGGAIFNDGTIGNISGKSTDNGYKAKFTNNSATTGGGAIYNIGVSIGDITGDFTSNSAGKGGAIYNTATINSIKNSSFSSNTATTSGGGAIYNDASGSILIANTSFTSNTATTLGGAIYNKASGGSLNIGGSDVAGTNTFSSNSATSGGAIYTDSSIENIYANFTENHATDKGGAIAVVTDSSNITVDAINGTYTGNYVNNTSGTAQGGAIYSKGNYNKTSYFSKTVTMAINGATFTGNYAQGTDDAQGGAIWNDQASTINFTGTNSFSNNKIIVNSVETPNDIYNAGTININGGTTTINGGITGTGTINIGGDTDGTLSLGNSATLTQKSVTIKTNGTLSANAANISVTGDTISNSGALKFTGGTNTNTITGGGTTIIDGTVTSTSSIANAITIYADKSLTIGVDNVGGTVSNAGTITLTGATVTLAQSIAGYNSTLGTTIIGDGTNETILSLGDSVSLTQKDLTVKNNAKLTANGANLTITNVVTNNGTIDLKYTADKSDATLNITDAATPTGTTNIDVAAGNTVNLTTTGITQDKLVLTGAGHLTMGGTGSIAAAVANKMTGSTYELRTTIDGTFDNTNGNAVFMGKHNEYKSAVTGQITNTSGTISFYNDGYSNNNIDCRYYIQEGITGDSTTVASNILNVGGTYNSTSYQTAVELSSGKSIEYQTINVNYGYLSAKDAIIANSVININAILNADVGNNGDNFKNNTVNNAGNLNIYGDGINNNAITGAGTTRILGNVTSNASIANAITVDSGKSLTIGANNVGGAVSNAGTITLTGTDVTLAKAISGAGTTIIDGTVISNASIGNYITVNAEKSLTTSGGNIGKAITNNGSLVLTNGTLAQAISGDGTTYIGNGTGSVNVTIGDGSVSQAVNIATNGTLISDIEKLGGTITNNGTFYMSGNLSKNIAGGDGTTVLQSTSAGVTDGVTIAGTLDMNDKTIAMIDTSDAAYQTLNVGKLTGTGNLTIDVDVTNVDNKAKNSDKINISGTSDSATLNLSSINIVNASDDYPTTTTPINNFVEYVTGTTSGITYQLKGDSSISTAVYNIYKPTRLFKFTLGDAGKLNMAVSENYMTLSDFIKGENGGADANTYSINADYLQTGNIGTTAIRTDSTKILSVFLNNGSDLTETSDTPTNSGFVVADGFTLNITGSTKDEHNSTISNFKQALVVNNGGTANVSDVTFKDNTSTSDYGGAICNNGTISTLNADFTGNKTTGVVSDSGHTYTQGGAIANIDTINCDITGNFNGNKAESDAEYINGGAIFNHNSITGDITGDFKSNSITATAGNGYGGAIATYSTIDGDITGDFTSNSITAVTGGFGGAIYYSSTTIDGDITGNFSNNSITTSAGSASGGAIYSYMATIDGDITGDFTSNSVTTSASSASGGAIKIKGTSAITGKISGDFKANTITGYSWAGGAALSVEGSVEAITGDFEGNIATATNGIVWGGAVNFGAVISNAITGDFKNNAAIAGNGTSYGGARGGAFDNYSSSKVTFEGNTFSGNYAKSTDTNPNYGAYGGAIINESSTDLVLKSTADKTLTFTKNYAQADVLNVTAYGGAIHNMSGGKLTITGATGHDVTFTGNYAKAAEYSETQAWGGAIYNKGTASLSGTNFTWNGYDNYNGESATNVITGLGGAIYNENSLTVTGENTFSNNSVIYSGGAIYNAGTASISGTNTFSYNSATGDDSDGGAIYNYSGTVSISGTNTFSYNSAKNGGAINNVGSLTVTEENTFSYNSAAYGGAINNADTASLSGTNTFSYNSATQGGAINNAGTASLSGTNTFSYNSATQGGAIYSIGNITNLNADFTENHATDKGGAISLSTLFLGTTVTSINGDFTGNYVDNSAGSVYGGAISSYKSGMGSITINNISGIFDKNYAKGANAYGGAIYNSGAMTITGSAFKGNYAQGTDDAQGGAIYNAGNMTLKQADSATEELWISGNSAIGTTSQGGAIYNAGTLNIYNNNTQNNNSIVFDKNSATQGGAIYNASSATINFGDSSHTMGQIEFLDNGTCDIYNDSNANLVFSNITTKFEGGGIKGSATGDNGLITIKDSANLAFVEGAVLENQNVTITKASGSNSSLKVGAGNITNSQITNNDELILTAGILTNNNITQNDSDAELRIVGNVTSNITGDNITAGTLVLNPDAVLKLGDAQGATVFGALNLNGLKDVDGTVGTLDILNGQQTAINYANVVANTGLNLNLDWGDTFNATGTVESPSTTTINLTKLNMTGALVNHEQLLTTTEGLLNSFNAGKLELTNATIETGNVVTYKTHDNQGYLYSKLGTLAETIKDTVTAPTSYAIMVTDEVAKDDVHDGIVKNDMSISGNGKTIINSTQNNGGIQVGQNKDDNVSLKVTNTNVQGIVLTNENEGAFTVTPDSSLEIVANSNDVKISGTQTSGSATNKNAIYLQSEDSKYSTATLAASNDKTVTIDDDIRSDNKDNKLIFKEGNVKLNGVLDPLTAINSGAEITKNNYDEDIQWQLNDGTLTYTNDKYLYDSTYHDGSTHKLNSIEFNGGCLDLRNGAYHDIVLDNITLSADSSIYVNADLAAEKMDTLNASSVTNNGGTLHVADIKLLSDATKDLTVIDFTSTANLRDNVDYTGGDIAYSPIYKYSVTYDGTGETGKFSFGRTGTGYSSYNPSVFASGIAAQMGGYLMQNQIYEQAFANMDQTMLMTREQREAMKLANKYAGLNENGMTYSPNQIPEETRGLWFRPFATFEKADLHGGPTVENTAYGSLFGGDSDLIELKNGWDFVWGAYAGYIGSHQNYNGGSIYQNGGAFGLNAFWYKGNFFTGLTANVGCSVAEASTLNGNDDITMLMTGIASKTGYNWELFNGKFIIQPSWLMSYTFVNTFDYTAAGGVSMHTSPLNAIQLAPGLKFIGNLKNGWQPYASVQMVWNIMDETKVTANNISLPEMSINPYIQYGVGVQKRWGDRFTGYGQVMMRNGGRNGVSLTAGFRWALGKNAESKKSEKKAIDKTAKISLSAK